MENAPKSVWAKRHRDIILMFYIYLPLTLLYNVLSMEVLYT